MKYLMIKHYSNFEKLKQTNAKKIFRMQLKKYINRRQSRHYRTVNIHQDLWIYLCVLILPEDITTFIRYQLFFTLCAVMFDRYWKMERPTKGPIQIQKWRRKTENTLFKG